MTTVTLKMYDEFNEIEVVRTIDGSNIMVNNTKAPLDFEHNIKGTEKQIEENLNKWISERGNDQHETLLTLISWEINN